MKELPRYLKPCPHVIIVRVVEILKYLCKRCSNIHQAVQVGIVPVLMSLVMEDFNPKYIWPCPYEVHTLLELTTILARDHKGPSTLRAYALCNWGQYNEDYNRFKKE